MKADVGLTRPPLGSGPLIGLFVEQQPLTLFLNDRFNQS